MICPTCGSPINLWNKKYYNKYHELLCHCCREVLKKVPNPEYVSYID